VGKEKLVKRREALLLLQLYLLTGRSPMTGGVASIACDMCVTETFGDPTQERVCHIRHKAFQAQGNSRNA